MQSQLMSKETGIQESFSVFSTLNALSGLQMVPTVELTLTLSPEDTSGLQVLTTSMVQVMELGPSTAFMKALKASLAVAQLNSR